MAAVPGSRLGRWRRRADMSSRLGRDFRFLWAAQTISLLGSSVALIALPWEAFTLTQSAAATAFLSAAQIAPYPLLGVVSGVVADLLDRRVSMIVSDLARAVLSGALALAIAIAALRFWMLLTITVLAGAFSTVFDAAYVSFTPHIVDRERLNAANGRLEASSAATGVVGPELGGILITAVGTAGVFILDAVSYAAGAAGSMLVRARATARSSGAGAGGWRGIAGMAREGIAYLRRSPVLLFLTAATSVLAVANGALTAMLIPLMRGELHYGEIAVGLVFSCGAAGWLVASILAARTKVTNRLPKGALPAVLLAAVSGVAIGMSRAPAETALAMFVFQGGVFYFLITMVTLRQRVVPLEILGRVHALARSLGNLGTPLGAALAGALVAGLPAAVVTSVLCSTPLALSVVLVRRAMHAEHPEGANAGSQPR